jgi:hypothetical protein
MGVPDLGKIQSVIKDPMVSDHFVIEFPNVPTGSADEETLMVQCQQVTKPGVTVNEVAVALFGHSVVYAGSKVFAHDLNITWVENVRGTIMRTFEKWDELIRGTTTQHGRFKQGTDGYASNAKLSIFDNKGDAALIYTIYNVWPASVPEVQFDGSSSNLITHSIGLKYDWYERTGGYTS